LQVEAGALAASARNVAVRVDPAGASGAAESGGLPADPSGVVCVASAFEQAVLAASTSVHRIAQRGRRHGA
jgi:hypothetical protein